MTDSDANLFFHAVQYESFAVVRRLVEELNIDVNAAERFTGRRVADAYAKSHILQLDAMEMAAFLFDECNAARPVAADLVAAVRCGNPQQAKWIAMQLPSLHLHLPRVAEALYRVLRSSHPRSPADCVDHQNAFVWVLASAARSYRPSQQEWADATVTAAKHGAHRVLSGLLHLKADPNCTTDGVPLWRALADGKIGVECEYVTTFCIEKLVEAGSNVDDSILRHLHRFSDRKDLWDALRPHLAKMDLNQALPPPAGRVHGVQSVALHRETGAMKLHSMLALLECKADANSRGETSGPTALHIVCMRAAYYPNKRQACVQALLDAKADIDALAVVDPAKKHVVTPMWSATQSDTVDVVEMLLDAKASVDRFVEEESLLASVVDCGDVTLVRKAIRASKLPVEAHGNLLPSTVRCAVTRDAARRKKAVDLCCAFVEEAERWSVRLFPDRYGFDLAFWLAPNSYHPDTNPLANPFPCLPLEIRARVFRFLRRPFTLLADKVQCAVPCCFQKHCSRTRVMNITPLDHAARHGLWDLVLRFVGCGAPVFDTRHSAHAFIRECCERADEFRYKAGWDFSGRPVPRGTSLPEMVASPYTRLKKGREAWMVFPAVHDVQCFCFNKSQEIGYWRTMQFMLMLESRFDALMVDTRDDRRAACRLLREWAKELYDSIDFDKVLF